MRKLPIEKLIERRLTDIGIGLPKFVDRIGYANRAKGLRKLEKLLNGEIDSNQWLIKRLPAALEISESEVKDAINQTKMVLLEEANILWRSSFKPNCLILTENNGRPRQIFIAAILNAGRYVSREFPENISESEYCSYIQDNINNWLVKVNKFYFEPTGYVINYTPDKATQFNLEGKKIADLEKANKQGILGFALK